MDLSHIAQPCRHMAPFGWYGGKGNLVRALLPLLPTDEQVYVEPYAGAASLLFHRRPGPNEVINDLHSEIVNLFRCLEDPPAFEALQHRLTWTLYSREEFVLALAVGPDADPVDRAWAFFVRQNQGFAGKATCEGNWGRQFCSARGMAGTTNQWRGRLKLLLWWHDRLSRVQVDHQDALACIRYWDAPGTLFYLDPPYTAGSRAAGNTAVYTHEADDAHHAALVELLLTLQGRAALSGCDTPVYAPLAAAGWTCKKFQTVCHAAGRTRGSGLQGSGAALAAVPRTECLWLSPGCAPQQELKL